MTALTDRFDRRITYLRLSVTDSCNFSCFYCKPEGGCSAEDEVGILTADEIIKIARHAAECGIAKIRLTGGEPLLRPDLTDIVRNIRAIPGISELTLTTNGYLLEKMAVPLAEAGLNRVNVSLDSLCPDTFRHITQGGEVVNTLRGVKAAIRVGLNPLKINVVLLKGLNGGEIEDFARLTFKGDIHVRFIEYMPMTGDRNRWHVHYLPLSAAMERCAAIAHMAEVSPEDNGGPARCFRLSGADGTIGFISPFSRHFCQECNRLRVSARGMLRGCLYNPSEINMRPLLDKDDAVRAAFAAALAVKPDPAAVESDPLIRCQSGRQGMLSIGG
jgi:cyclic pyranopterin phosphate synthase